MTKVPMRAAMTGAAGQISYALLSRIVAGEMSNKDRPVILQLPEILDEKTQKVLKDVMMETKDCAFSLLIGMEAHSDPMTVFKDVDVALLVGACPRDPGVGCTGLLSANARIFAAQGKALNVVASCNIKVLMAENPINTNAYTAMKLTPGLSRENFTTTLCLDHSHALSQIAVRTGKPALSIERLLVWSNHSLTMYTDYRYITIDGKSVKDMISDSMWNNDTFPPTVGKRGAAIIKVHDLPPTASTANAAIDHVHDWMLGNNGKIVIMGISSNGEYGIPKDVMFGPPIAAENDKCKIIKGLEIDEYSQGRVKTTLDELETERAGVQHLLQSA